MYLLLALVTLAWNGRSAEHIGFDVTLINRSERILTSFDGDIAKLLLDEMLKAGIQFRSQCIPEELFKTDDGRI
ncbi:MAG: NAD-binding protein [Bdellovibrionales bacterium]